MFELKNNLNNIKYYQFDTIKFINNLNFVFFKFSAYRYSSYFPISNYIEVQVKKNFKNKVYGTNINNNDLNKVFLKNFYYKNLNIFINQLNLPFLFFFIIRTKCNTIYK